MSSDETRGFAEPGVRRTLAVGGMFVCLAVLPYGVPGLDKLRAWMPGDAVPFSRLVGLGDDATGTREALPTWAAGGSPAEPAAEEGTPVSDRDLLAGALVAGPAGGSAPVAPTPTQTPGGSSPAQTPTARPAAPAGPAGGAAPPPSPPPRAIELPAPTALTHWNERLGAAADRTPGATARMLVYGASTLGTDTITSALRRRLQKQFGDGGKGFVVAAPAWPTQAHKDVRWKQRGDPWRTYPVTHRSKKDGRYGLGGVLARNDGHSRTMFSTVARGPVGDRIARFELWYQVGPRGGELELLLDGVTQGTLNTHAEAAADQIHRLSFPDGPHKVEVRARRGRVQIYGAVLERDTPGVVVDTAMLIGSRANRLLNFDPGHWASQVQRRGSDLLVLFMGDNEIESDPPPNLARFEADFHSVLQRMRAGRPEASCLVLSPTDHGTRRRGRVVTVPLVTRVVEIERRVALAEGCAFLDLFQAMGGEGAMGRWFKARPRLGWGDFVHFTERGSEVLGLLIHQALAYEYDRWLQTRGPSLSSPAGPPGPPASSAAPSPHESTPQGVSHGLGERPEAPAGPSPAAPAAPPPPASPPGAPTP